jgi:hypothetical protein
LITEPTFLAATQIYGVAERYRFSRHPVNDDLFGRFSKELGTLQRELGEDREDPFWEAVMPPLRRFRFEFTGYPLPFNHPEYLADDTATYLLSQLSNCDRIFPRHAPRAGLVLNTLLSLLQRPTNPLGESLASALSKRQDEALGILMLRSRYRKAVDDFLKARGIEATCLGPNDLSDNRLFGSLAIVGPLRWYPPSILSAPRAANIELFTYDWIGDQQPRLSLLQASQSAISDGLTVLGSDSARAETAVIDADDLVPAIPWVTLSQRLTGHEASQEGADSVASYLFLLSEGFMVFLEAEANATTSVLSLTGDITERIKRVPNVDIQPGMYMLLRSEGGGDYIVSVADILLGSTASPLREKQKLWKARLRAKILESGISEVVRELRAVGSRIADEQNVRNWASAHSLKTAERQDFAAIMLYVGLASQAADLWTSMALLDSAHRRAGARIRKQLLNKVRSTSLGQLQSLGKIDFVLPESEGGAISGFRVEDRSPNPTPVPTTRLGKPIRVERDLWQG